jgi:hypothetical protein
MNTDELLLLKSYVDNENNESILNMTSSKIKNNKNFIFDELPINIKYRNELKKKLKNYRYIDEIDELHIGTYIRWIKVKDTENELKLTNGGILLDVLFENNIYLQLKNNLNKIFKINFNENLIFQKLTNQEIIILYAIDNIDNINKL